MCIKDYSRVHILHAAACALMMTNVYADDKMSLTFQIQDRQAQYSHQTNSFHVIVRHATCIWPLIQLQYVQLGMEGGTYSEWRRFDLRRFTHGCDVHKGAQSMKIDQRLVGCRCARYSHTKSEVHVLWDVLWGMKRAGLLWVTSMWVVFDTICE